MIRLYVYKLKSFYHRMILARVGDDVRYRDSGGYMDALRKHHGVALNPHEFQQLNSRKVK